jgi:DNA repair protein RadC
MTDIGGIPALSKKEYLLGKEEQGKVSVHAGHRERVKELFLKTGLDSFSPHAVLELLLYYAIPQKDTNALAHRLIRQFGSLSAVFDAPFEELLKVDGIGRSAAILIKMIPQLCRRYEEDLQDGQLSIFDYEEAGKLFVKKYIGRKNESVMLMLLDSRERVLYCDVVSEGNATAANIYIKKIVSLASRYDAVYAILAHNHPSGECLPSKQDLDTTRWVYHALETIEVQLIDHIIVGSNNYISLAKSKIMPELFNQELDME